MQKWLTFAKVVDLDHPDSITLEAEGRPLFVRLSLSPFKCLFVHFGQYLLSPAAI
jgi:hypothetical protein